MTLDASIPLKANYAIPESPTDTALKEQQIMTLKDALNDPMKKQLEQQKLDAGSLENMLSKQKVVTQLLGGANDQTSWEQGLASAQQMGLPVQGIPRVFDPKLRDNLLLRSMDAEKRMTLQFEQQKFGETERHNRATEANASKPRGGTTYVDPDTGEVTTVPKLPSQDEKQLNDMRDTANIARGLEAPLQRFKEVSPKVNYKGNPVLNMVPSFSKNAKTLENLNDQLALASSSLLKGSTSDKDVKFASSQNPSIDYPDEVNQEIIAGKEAAIERVKNQASFFDAWAEKYGSLKGANQAWDQFVDTKPLFTDEKLNKDNINIGVRDWEPFLDRRNNRASAQPEKNQDTGVSPSASPLPPKAQLKMGQTYPTKRGPALWDGKMFQPVRK